MASAINVFDKSCVLKSASLLALESQKQVFTCECGSEIRTAGRAEHYRSVKHKNYIESIAKANSEIS
jgi:hypothetical protein